jgi:hypothetical protein
MTSRSVDLETVKIMTSRSVFERDEHIMRSLIILRLLDTYRYCRVVVGWKSEFGAGFDATDRPELIAHLANSPPTTLAENEHDVQRGLHHLQSLSMVVFVF